MAGTGWSMQAVAQAAQLDPRWRTLCPQRVSSKCSNVKGTMGTQALAATVGVKLWTSGGVVAVISDSAIATTPAALYSKGLNGTTSAFAPSTLGERMAADSHSPLGNITVPFLIFGHHICITNFLY